MKLKTIISLLEKFPESQYVEQGFGNPHSWRGSYDELSFEPVDNTTVGEMLQAAKSAVGETYQGWKGGDYTMTLDTEVNIDYIGSWSDGKHEHLLYDWLIQE